MAQNPTISNLHETIQAYLPENVQQHHHEEQHPRTFSDLIRLVHNLSHKSGKRARNRR